MKTVTTLHTTDIHTYKQNNIHIGVLWQQQHCTAQKRQLYLYHTDEAGQLTPELGQLCAPNSATLATAKSIHFVGLPISTGPTNEEPNQASYWQRHDLLHCCNSTVDPPLLAQARLSPRLKLTSVPSSTALLLCQPVQFFFLIGYPPLSRDLLKSCPKWILIRAPEICDLSQQDSRRHKNWALQSRERKLLPPTFCFATRSAESTLGPS